jgi:hypothetical protein
MLVYALVDGYLLRNGIAPDVKQEAFMSPPSKRQWGDGERQLSRGRTNNEQI